MWTLYDQVETLDAAVITSIFQGQQEVGLQEAYYGFQTQINFFCEKGNN